MVPYGSSASMLGSLGPAGASGDSNDSATPGGGLDVQPHDPVRGVGSPPFVASVAGRQGGGREDASYGFIGAGGRAADPMLTDTQGDEMSRVGNAKAGSSSWASKKHA